MSIALAVLSAFGLLGLGRAREEGIELNILGLAVDFEFKYRAVRVPGIGWLSVLPRR